ncbi:DNA adenine methylase [Paraburkholderia fungorum]|uniref:DNA adenine methylase n=1 Tax=Paraburkholderia fungorum TaxID=134537 RepID=UPI0038BA6935
MTLTAIVPRSSSIFHGHCLCPISYRSRPPGGRSEDIDALAKCGDTLAMRYDGGKGTCYAQIINLMPPHARYVETHLGGGAVMRNKKVAATQIGIERDAAVIEATEEALTGLCTLVHGDAIEWLQSTSLDADTLIYVDPPYHPETRRRARVYRHDYSAEDHERLLNILTKLPCMVLISGYDCALYQERLADWGQYRFQVRTRVGMREECVWFNYPKPEILHDDRYLGDGFRQREIIRRRKDRLRQRVLKLSIAEKASLHEWLGDLIAGECDK